MAIRTSTATRNRSRHPKNPPTPGLEHTHYTENLTTDYAMNSVIGTNTTEKQLTPKSRDNPRARTAS